MKHLARMIFGFASLLLCACSTTSPASLGPNSTQAKSDASKTLYLTIVENLIRDDQAFAAIAHLDEYDLKYGANAESQKLRADALLRAGKTDEANRIYLALTKTSLAADGWNGLGKVASQRENWQKAADYFYAAAKAAPAQADFLGNLGFALIQTQNFADAEFVLKEARQLAPDDRLVANNVVLLLAQTERPDRLDEFFPDKGVSSGFEPGKLEELMESYSARRSKGHLADARIP